MFKHWISRLPMFSVAHNAPDTGSGGGSSDPSGSGDASTASNGSADQDGGDDAGAGDDSATRATGDADPDQELEALLDDDGGDDLRPVEERLQAILPAHKRVKRELRKLMPIKRQLKEAGITNLGDAISKAQYFDRIQQMADEDPRGLARLLGIDVTPSSATPARGASPRVTENAAGGGGDLIDVSKLPFDINNGDPVNQFMGMIIGKLNETHRELTALKGDHSNLRTSARERAEREHRSSWKSAVDAAAAKIPDAGVRTVFQDAMALARNEPRARQMGVQKLIDHYLTKLGVGGQAKQRANDAARQRIAQNTSQLPRQHAGTGTPASARGNSRKTFASIREKLDAEA
jgi:hypothetical protein